MSVRGDGGGDRRRGGGRDMRDNYRGPGDTARYLDERRFQEQQRGERATWPPRGQAAGGNEPGRGSRDDAPADRRGDGRRGRRGDEDEVREERRPRAHVELPPAGGRGLLNKPEPPLCPIRTPHWTDDLVRELDDRNVMRMRCLPPQWQRHVVLTYSTDGAVRDVQKHVSGTIGGVRRLIIGGMSPREAGRL